MLGKTVSSLGPIALERVDVDAQHAEPATLLCAIDLIESGDLGRAGNAPACPENHQDHVAFQVGQAHRLAVEVGPFDRRGRLADHAELVEAAGTEPLYGRVIRFLEQHLKGFPRDVKLVSLEKTLVISFANRQQGGRVERGSDRFTGMSPF